MEQLKERWVDVFITKDNVDARNGTLYEEDDEFVGHVLSVDFFTGEPETAKIVPYATEWLGLAFTHDYSSTKPIHERLLNAKVGELIRVGTATTDGYTDWLTVTEVRKDVTKLWNGTSSPLYLSTASNASETTDVLTVNTRKTLSTPFLAVRVNMNLDCTSVPAAAKGGPTNGLADRHKPLFYTKYSGLTGSADYPAYYYPAFMSKQWLNGNSLRANLENYIREIYEIRLIGYTLVNKRQIGVQHGHELIDDDYLIMRIGGVPGRVISNNSFCRGAFAVVHAGHGHDNLQGAVEFHIFNKDGLASHTFSPPSSMLKTMEIELLSRDGGPAQFGRIHLWFQLRVGSGM